MLPACGTSLLTATGNFSIFDNQHRFGSCDDPQHHEKETATDHAKMFLLFSDDVFFNLFYAV